MNLLSGLWKWMSAAAGVAAAVAFALWRIADARRETAEARADVAEANLEASERVRAKEAGVRKARDQARARAEKVEAEIEADRQAGRRERWADPRLQGGRDSDGSGGEG